jgi:hypothetical protein
LQLHLPTPTITGDTIGITEITLWSWSFRANQARLFFVERPKAPVESNPLTPASFGVIVGWRMAFSFAGNGRDNFSYPSQFHRGAILAIIRAHGRP